MTTAKHETQQSITPLQQMASSCVGALATSLLMTPLDVVKTRLQAQSQVLPIDIHGRPPTQSSGFF